MKCLAVSIFILIASAYTIVADNDFKRICYFRIKDSLDVQGINGTLCTHIIYGFATVSSDGQLVPSSDDDVQWYEKVATLKYRYPGVKVMLSVGGAGSTDTFHKVSENLFSRLDFSRSVVQLLDMYNFDGLDVDWEFPAYLSPWPEDFDLFPLLLKQLHAHLHRVDKILSIAVAGDFTIADQSYLYEAVVRHVDLINVMCYDFHTYKWFAPFTGYNSPLFNRSQEEGYFAKINVAYAANYWYSKGAPKEKLMIGVPTYAQTYILENPSINNGTGAPAKGSLGQWDYMSVCDLIRQPDAVIRFDNEARVPYAFHNTTWISYENEQSIKEKAAWIKGNGFGGIMTFDLNSDDFLFKCDQQRKFPLHSTIFEVSNYHN